jgi:DNA-binding NarL/FixJ family response regulator
MNRPRIILADDHRVFAEGLRSLLDAECDVVGIVEDGQALLDAVDDLTPDLVVSDVSMPKLNGIECVRRFRESHPTLKVILLTMHEDVDLATAAIRAGAAGYVLKHGGTQDVLRAVEEALQGGVHISSRIAREVMQALASGKNIKPELTPRQAEILRLLVDGLSAKEIAARLHLSPRTVEFHKYQTMERVGVSSSAELIAYALKKGIGSI